MRGTSRVIPRPLHLLPEKPVALLPLLTKPVARLIAQVLRLGKALALPLFTSWMGIESLLLATLFIVGLIFS